MIPIYLYLKIHRSGTSANYHWRHCLCWTGRHNFSNGTAKSLCYIRYYSVSDSELIKYCYSKERRH